MKKPQIFYGTAWKEDRTESLVLQALQAGFRAIDTANQRKHYFEEGVGRAIQKFIGDGSIQRSEIFIQSKFTSIGGQDHRLPYDPRAPAQDQVFQSLESSLKHLGTTYLDSYVLHGPCQGGIISEMDLEIWSAMEDLFNEGKVKALGVSNVSYDQLATLYTHAKVKPSWVQIRTYASRRWEIDIRKFCREVEIAYQGFSLLTANRHEIDSPIIDGLARKFQRSVPEVVLRACVQMGIIPITGTTSTEHMQQDLSIFEFSLETEEVQKIEQIIELG